MSHLGPSYRSLTARLTQPASAAAGEHETSPEFPLPLYGTLIFAGIRLLGLAVAAFLLRRGRFRDLHASLADLLRSWDAGRYLLIAAHGYPRNANIVWFPGYPAAIRALDWIPGISPVRAALAVSTAAGLVAAWGLTRLVMTLTDNRRISLLTTALWAVAPASFVLSMVYSEALFCALAIWALIALVERRWLTAAGLTILAGTVRSTALALVAAIAVAALPPVIRAVRAREPIGTWWRPAAAVVTAPLGLVGYWAYSAWATHHLGGFVWVENNAHNSFDWGNGIILAAKQAIIYGPNASVALTLLVIAAAIILTAYSLAERIPVYLHAYTLVVVLLALTPGPYFLGSKPRFLLPAMLLGLPLARLLARARIWVLIPVIAILAAASTWFGIYLMTTGWAP